MHLSCPSRALAVGVLAAPTTAQAVSDHSPFTFAVIGDIPYGDAQTARFPSVVDQINADPAVRFVDHLGDIKSGSTGVDDYLRVRVDPHSPAVLTWERVPFSS